MRPRTQTTRTNHLGYDVGASRKIPDGALAGAATTECLDDTCVKGRVCKFYATTPL